MFFNVFHPVDLYVLAMTVLRVHFKFVKQLPYILIRIYVFPNKDFTCFLIGHTCFLITTYIFLYEDSIFAHQDVNLW